MKEFSGKSLSALELIDLAINAHKESTAHHESTIKSLEAEVERLREIIKRYGIIL